MRLLVCYYVRMVLCNSSSMHFKVTKRASATMIRKPSMPILIWVVLTSTKLLLAELMWGHYVAPDSVERCAAVVTKPSCYSGMTPAFCLTAHHSSSPLYFPGLSETPLVPQWSSQLHVFTVLGLTRGPCSAVCLLKQKSPISVLGWGWGLPGCCRWAVTPFLFLIYWNLLGVLTVHPLPPCPRVAEGFSLSLWVFLCTPSS